MAFCAHCGRPVQAGLAACPACGTPLDTISPRAPGPATHADAAPADARPDAPRGPVGATRPPGKVVVLSIVTLGIYHFVWWWRISRELDAHAGTPGHAHRPIRRSLHLLLATMGLVLAGVVILASALFTAAPAEGETAEPGAGAGAAAVLGMLLLAAALIAGVVGVVLQYVGMWRAWSAIRADEVRRHAPDPLSPGIQLLLYLVPYVNIVTMFIAIHRTQTRLNAMWTASAAPT